MKTISRWVVIILLALITINLISKGIELWSLGANVDGDGIGIYFFGLEINDRVQESNIPTYAIGFFAAGLITLLLALALVGKAILRNNGNSSRVTDK